MLRPCDVWVCYLTGVVVMAWSCWRWRNEYGMSGWRGVADMSLGILLWPFAIIVSFARYR